MKNFFKYGFLTLLVILLIGTLFNSTSNNEKQVELDSNILIVESNDDIEINDNETPKPESANVFAKIGAFISNVIYKIFNFFFSFISHIFVRIKVGLNFLYV